MPLIMKTGFTQHVFVAGRIISFCSVSEQGPWIMLRQCLQRSNGQMGSFTIQWSEEALSMHKNMRNKGKAADNFTFCFLLKICGQSTAVESGKQIHCCVVKQGLEFHVFVRNTLIRTYGLFKDMLAAHKLFEEIPNIDLVSWNICLDGYVHCGQYKEARGMFLRMQRSSFRPDEATLVVVLSACSELGILDFSRFVHSSISRSILNQSISLSNYLIDMYARCGDIDRAVQLFEDMKDRNTIAWNSMIIGLAMQGHSGDALRLLDQMLYCDQPYNESNDIMFLGLLCACSHGGLVEEGRRHFVRMQITP